jgi:hypothetical protein
MKRMLRHQWNASAMHSSDCYTTCPSIRTSPKNRLNNQFPEHHARKTYPATDLGLQQEILLIHLGTRHQRSHFQRALVFRAQLQLPGPRYEPDSGGEPIVSGKVNKIPSDILQPQDPDKGATNFYCKNLERLVDI